MWCRFIEPILVTGNFRKSFINFIASGMFRIMLGGWLDLLCTYRGVVAGFENGLNLPVVRSRVTSRKLTIFLFASMVIRRLFWANILHISFLIFSFSGKESSSALPSSPSHYPLLIKKLIDCINQSYYSFKIFPRFWLAKSTRFVHHNQLLMTKFGRILTLMRKWRQKCSVFAG